MAGQKPHLNVIFIGHIDHGKSTTVGRLMYDTGNLSEQDCRKLEALAKEKGKGTFAFAFLMDTLKEERERGVTIDVNYKKFSTQKNDFTIIDAPGHQDYVKNMVTGTSQADAAVLIVAAKEGVQPQTREHAFLAQVMGIKKMVVAINKMDEVNYSEERYKEVKEDVLKLLKSSGFKEENLTFVPISSWVGQNIIKAPDKMPWFKGPTLLEAIDSFPAPESPIDKPLGC